MVQNEWNPEVGPTFRAFMSGQPEELVETVTRSTMRILGRSVRDQVEPARSAQLVVGEVQSGKTMSFTGVLSLARDNGFPIIVILAGTKKNLLEQTVDRLTEDLNLDGDGGANPWKLFVQPAGSNANVKALESLIQTWESDIPDEFKQAALIVTLKTKPSIDKVTALLTELAGRSSLDDIPTIVIDDEADQAGLNVDIGSDTGSAIYGAISRLRRSLPRHTYLMYTATPQAPLIIDLADHLSPDCVTMLQAGPDYIGGTDLFVNDFRFGQVIPDLEIAGATDPHPSAIAPKSLRKALAYYLLALAVAQRRQSPKPISMLIHPATGRGVHRKYAEWVEAIFASWKVALTHSDSSEFMHCLRNDFSEAYISLKGTVEGLPSDWPASSEEARLAAMLSNVCNWLSANLIEVRVVNSDKESRSIRPQHWKQHAGWVVIGGSKLDRGFTIENLVVTYMPRGAGIGNADSIQQRGRFFGYKRKYQDLLRGWFNSDTIDAFTAYVKHEESMRGELTKVDESGISLKMWKRAFLLDPSLNPTRRNVISMMVQHHTFREGFVFQQRYLFGQDFEAASDASIATDLESLKPEMYIHEIDTRGPSDHPHLTRTMPLEDMMEVLTRWVVGGPDSHGLSPLLFTLRALLEDAPGRIAQLVLMDSLHERVRSAVKNPDGSYPADTESWQIGNLMSGRSEDGTYAGDSAVCDPNLITVQVHNVVPSKKQVRMAPNALALAVRWPADLKLGVVHEQ